METYTGMLHIVQSNITLVAYMGALSLMNAENLNKHKPHFPFEGALLMGTLLRDYSMCTTDLWVNMNLG